MRKLRITVLSTWLVWAGCGASNAQQGKRDEPTKLQGTQGNGGPSLQETLDFLNNTFRGGVGDDAMRTCQNSHGRIYPGGWSSVYWLQSDQFPIVVVTRQSTTVESNGALTKQTVVHPVDLSKVDPQLVPIEKREPTDQGDGWSCAPHVIFFVVHLVGTNKQPISDAGSEFDITFSSEELANRVAKAMKRAVELAGGKPSAF